MSDVDLTDRHVLLVEDEYLLARNVMRRLEGWGATILGPVGTIELALELLARALRIDLAVLDVNLRGVQAFPVADALRSRRIPFVFTTGYEESTIPERFRDVPILQKPVRRDAFANGLLALIAGAAAGNAVLRAGGREHGPMGRTGAGDDLRSG